MPGLSTERESGDNHRIAHRSCPPQRRCRSRRYRLRPMQEPISNPLTSGKRMRCWRKRKPL